MAAFSLRAPNRAKRPARRGALRATATPSANGRDVPRPLRSDAVLNAIANAVVVTDAAGGITWCNAAFSQLCGYGLGEMRGRKPGDLLQWVDTDPATVVAMRTAQRNGEPFSGRVLNRAKSGRGYWAALRIDPLFDPDGRLDGFVSVQYDATAQQLGDEHLRSVVDSAAAIIVQNAHGEVIRCNPQAERLLGSTCFRLPAPDVGWRWLCDDGSPLERDHHPAVRALHSGHEVTGAVIGISQDDGSARWLQVDCRLIEGQAEGAGRAVVSSYTDVSAQRAALAELAAEQRRLTAALDGTQAGVWEWNVQTGECRVNAQWVEMLGYPTNDLTPTTIDTWMGLVHPNDIPRLAEYQRRHAAGLAAYFDVDCRVRHKTRRWMWVSVRGRIATRTADGCAQWMYGTHVDIDAAKESALAVERANAKLQGLFALSPLGIALTDLEDGRFLEYNDALLGMLGYDRQEFGALHSRDIAPPECRPEMSRQIIALIETGRYGPVETDLLHKSGRRIPAQVSGIRVRLPDGTARIWSILQDISPRRTLELQLREEARTDRLTGLANRALLMERLQASVARARADAANSFMLLFIDFDRFKVVNDTLGHDSGDQLLRIIADRLRDALREGDLFGSTVAQRNVRNLVARFGGDEFVVLLHDIEGEDAARSIAERLLAIFATPYVVHGKELHSSASIGVVLADGACESAASVLRNADMAMYEAKRAGRARMAFFDPDMLRRLTRSVRIEEGLRHAIELGQLSVVYQPIVNLNTGQVASAEALLRWFHPELGQVSPAEFIPIAEDAGLIIEIGDWVLREACFQAQRWRRDDPEHAPQTISVNLSRVQMMQGDRQLERVAAVLAETGLQPEQLQLEVTEREVMRDPTAANRLMDGLRALGVRLAMDDFGTGASSLGCLREFPFDVVKIDKSFIDNLAGSPEMLAVVHATVAVVENLGMVSVAEGIEQEAQVGILQSLGCRYGQGYFFSRPVPGERLLGAVRVQDRSPA